MSGESPKKIGRGYERNLDAGQFQPMIDSWDLHLDRVASTPSCSTGPHSANRSRHVPPTGFEPVPPP